MMTDLPDAPWIVDAEQNGYPHAEPVKCPVCGKECETIYQDLHMGDVVGWTCVLQRKMPGTGRKKKERMTRNESIHRI